MTNERMCILSSKCKMSGTESCTKLCEYFISIQGRLRNANAPQDYKLLTLVSSPAKEEQAGIYKTIEGYVSTFERQFDEELKRIKSLYLFSVNPGNGKTSTAVALMNEFIIVHYLGSLKRGRQPLQTPAVFLDVNSFQTDYNLATMTKDEKGLTEIKSTIQRTQQAPFLVMDDVGIRSASEAFKSYVHAIVNYRTTNSLPTIFTSNLPIEEMAEVFDSRLYDRMRDQCLQLVFAGESKRGRR